MKLPLKLRERGASFIGGVHPPEGKSLTEHKEIERYVPKAGGEFVFPLSQHIGAPCAPVVNKGDRVLAGQKIADSEAFVSAPIFASISGVVKEIGPRMTVAGSVDPCIVIENDGLYEQAPALFDLKNKPSVNDYIKVIRSAGIVGMGGACFPTHVKLSPPKDKVINWVILNGAECEPYLTCDNRLMIEEADAIVDGFAMVLKLFPKAHGIIAIESNKPEAIEIIGQKIAEKKIKNISVMPHKVKYPQGAEKMLIWSITGQEIPAGIGPLPPALPADVGCIILNTRTVWQIYSALTKGLPVTERVISVTGDAIANPRNLRVPLGVSVRELINACGGFNYNGFEPVKILGGGPMMGISMRSLDVPVVKGTSGILALSKFTAHIEDESNCLRCGRCIDACPMRLDPELLDKAVRRRDYKLFEEHLGTNCIECGCCSFICPASRHLTQSLREGKAAVMAARRKAQAQAQQASQSSKQEAAKK